MQRKILRLFRYSALPVKLLLVIALCALLVFVTILDGVTIADLIDRAGLPVKTAGAIFYIKVLMVAWFIYNSNESFYFEKK